METRQSFFSKEPFEDKGMILHKRSGTRMRWIAFNEPKISKRHGVDTVTPLREEIRRYFDDIRQQRLPLFLDLGPTIYVDVAAISAFLIARWMHMTNFLEFRLYSPSAQVEEMLQVDHLDAVLNFHTSMEEFEPLEEKAIV